MTDITMAIFRKQGKQATQIRNLLTEPFLRKQNKVGPIGVPRWRSLRTTGGTRTTVWEPLD